MVNNELFGRSGRLRRVLAALGIAFISLPLAGNADADALPRELGNEIQVESASAIVGEVGGFTKVGFRVVNDSGAPVVLLGVRSSIADNAKLVARIDTSDTTELESISVPTGEMLDLTTSHLWYELFPLSAKLEAGDVFELTVDLVDARFVIDVHVH